MENVIKKTISHYQILEQIGKGGMGIVYKANDLKLERTVAIKVLTPEAMSDAVSLERFLREARAAAKLNHPNITTIYAIEEVEDTIFIAMEYILGPTLSQLMGERSLTLEQILDIAIQIAQGLEEAHRQNVIHRDIKPDNIMRSETGRIKIMDFGLAKIRGQSRLTRDGFSMGTIDYMSPEQINHEHEHEVDQRSDLFSYGTLLYEMITGNLPFKGDHDWAVLYAILNNEPEPIAENIIPKVFETLVFKCLKKNPQQRYQSSQEIIRDLIGIQQQYFRTQPLPISRRLNWWWVSAIGGLILLIIAGLFLWGPFAGPSPKTLNNQAVELLKQHQFSLAKSKLHAAIQRDSAFSSAWSNLAMAFYFENQIDSTIYFAAQALKTDSTNVIAYSILGRAYELQEQFEQAIQIYRQAIKRDSLFIEAYINAGSLLIMQDQMEPALTLLTIAIRKSKNPTEKAYISKHLGIIYFQKQQYTEAVAYFRQALHLFPKIEDVGPLLKEAVTAQTLSGK